MPEKCLDCDAPITNPYLKRCNPCDEKNNKKHSPDWKPLDVERV